MLDSERNNYIIQLEYKRYYLSIYMSVLEYDLHNMFVFNIELFLNICFILLRHLTFLCQKPFQHIDRICDI